MFAGHPRPGGRRRRTPCLDRHQIRAPPPRFGRCAPERFRGSARGTGPDHNVFHALVLSLVSQRTAPTGHHSPVGCFPMPRV
jgi:hypothetical protein